MGSKRVTVQNLEVVRVDAENNLLLVKGAVPGPKKALVTTQRETVKAGKVNAEDRKGGTLQMAKVSVYNMEGKEVGTMELNDAVFGVEVNEHLVHMAVVQQLANNRQGTQKAKTRSEVIRRRKKTLETEGNRSCKTGIHKSSPVDRRRRCVRTDPERLYFQAEQEGEESWLSSLL